MEIRVKLLLCLTLLIAGCANKIILHPLTGADIYDGSKPGDICFSKLYLDEVIKIKIERSR